MPPIQRPARQPPLPADSPSDGQPQGRGGNSLPAPPGRCYGYARVRTVAQATEGESLDVQQRVIGGYATMQGLTLDKVFVERFSGWS